MTSPDEAGSPVEGPVEGKKKGKGIISGVAKLGTAPARASVKVAKGFWWGFRFPWRGAKMVYFKHPSLIRIWIWPVLITIICMIAVGWAVIAWHDDLLALMWSAPEGEGFWVTVEQYARPVAQILIFIIMLVLGVLIIYLLSSVLAGPFNGMLSEEVERLAKGNPAPPFSIKTMVRDALLTIRLEGGKLLIYGLVMGPLFIASLLIPVVGQGLYSIFGVLFTMFFFSVDYTDWPLARRGHGAVARLRLVRAHFSRMFGLGVGVWLFLMIPFINLLFMPAAVAGGTLLVLDLEDDGSLPDPRRPGTVPTSR